MESFNKPSKIYDLVSLTVLFLVIFVLHHKLAYLGLDLHHDTFLTAAAIQFNNGVLPYKEFFYQYNLASLFLHAFTLTLTEGNEILALKILTAISFTLISIFIYLTIRQISTRFNAFLLALLWGLLSPFSMINQNGYHAWPTVYMTLMIVISLSIIVYAVRRKSSLIFGFSGVFLALSFWFKQPAAYTIILIVMALLFLYFKDVKHKKFYLKSTLYLAFFGFLTSSIFFVYALSNELLNDWWRVAVVFNSYFALDSNSSKSLLQIIFGFLPISRELGWISILWAILPVFLSILFYLDLKDQITKKKDNNLKFFIYSALIAGWISYFPLPHSFHTHLFMAPAFIFFAFYLPNININFFQISLAGNDLLQKVIPLVLVIVMVYEALWHVYGAIQKVRLFKPLNTRAINFNSIADGLYLNKDQYYDFLNFYKKVKGSDSCKAGIINLSVDNIATLMPNLSLASKMQSMPQFWGWPNHLFSQTYFKELDHAISQKKYCLITDDMVYIDGYIPISSLYLPSPISSHHVLQVPAISSEVISLDDKVTQKYSTPARIIIELPKDALEFIRKNKISSIVIRNADIVDFPHKIPNIWVDYYYKIRYKNLINDSFFMESDSKLASIFNATEENQKVFEKILLSDGKYLRPQVYFRAFKIDNISDGVIMSEDLVCYNYASSHSSADSLPIKLSNFLSNKHIYIDISSIFSSPSYSGLLSIQLISPDKKDLVLEYRY
jgi:hypothetical protein